MPLFLEEWEFDLGSFLLAIPLFGSVLFFEIALCLKQVLRSLCTTSKALYGQFQTIRIDS